MSKEWDDADAACRKAIGPGWCAVADESGHPSNPLHCSNAIMGKKGDMKFQTRRLVIKKETEVKAKSPK